MPPTVQTDNAPRVRFSATIVQEPGIEVALHGFAPKVGVEH